ncbi:MAG TPA: vWA domain-containing protein [Blastocatellia bacterium]|nr:vWA domain-containing protein [Blastocatellia bacterium]
MKLLTVRTVIALLIVGVGISVAQAWFARSPAPVPPVGDEPPSDQVPNQTIGGSTLEMVFVLDTTGSMGGLLEGAKQRIWGIVNEVMQSSSHPSVRVGLVAYRDRGDAYVTRVLPVTADLDQVYATLMSYRAEGGGDGPEDVRRALADGVRHAGWSPPSQGIAQIIFLVGDAPPHEDYKDEPSTATTTAEAVKAGMTVNTIQCGNMPGTQTVWQAIAQHGEGQYFPIAQDGGVQAIATPYDKEMSELGAKIGSTYVAYGGGGGAAGASYRGSANERQAAMEAKVVLDAPAPAKADRAVNKAVNKEAYVGDLLTSLENGSLKLDSVKDEDLTDDLRKLEPAARQKEIERRLAVRKTLRDDILKLSKQRDEFITAARKKQSGHAKSFDSVVAAALKEQLSRKGIK